MHVRERPRLRSGAPRVRTLRCLVANRFERLALKLLDAATGELHVRSLGAALARTSRQLHTLEYRIAPDLRARIERITGALDEREEHTRLRQLRHRRA